MERANRRLFDLEESEARAHLLTSKSYFDMTLPEYFDFGPILGAAYELSEDIELAQLLAWRPENHVGVNYTLFSNKDGRLAWRPFELFNPIIYAKFVGILTLPENWQTLKKRFADFQKSSVECCSIPVVSTGEMTDVAETILSWWEKVEQRSIALSLEYSHVALTDVTNCYPSIYTHSISWALHDRSFIRQGKNRTDRSFLGNQLDELVRKSREGQTNGIPQASTISHILAELVLGYCDLLITEKISDDIDVKILRYRDDYRIFGNSDSDCLDALHVISNQLARFGMRLGASKTSTSANVIESAVKPAKVAALNLSVQQKTLQKELLSIHSFCLENPGAGVLKLLMKDYVKGLTRQLNGGRFALENKTVLIAILLDISVVSPNVFPAVARAVTLILSKLNDEERVDLFQLVLKKAGRLPNSGYLDVWLQRMALPSGVKFSTKEKMCLAVENEANGLWNFDWIESRNAQESMRGYGVVDKTAVERAAPIIGDAEIDDFWTEPIS